MKAEVRAILDEKAGDLGSARRRLMSLASSSTYDPRLCEQIARICVKMSDPKEAGRWYFLSDSDDPESPGCITEFLEQFNRSPKQAIQQIPANLRLESPESYPPVVGARLRAAEFQGVPRKRKPERGADGKTWKDRAIGAGCLVATAFLLIAIVVGVGTIGAFIAKIIRSL
ncbi:MAG: hypothetical protein IT434_01425 [Phycisphaerales bacterium]|nr:hypothetical protein [Phycisphaerales bacterium]